MTLLPKRGRNTLTLTPLLTGPNVVGTNQTFTATLNDAFGAPVSGATIAFNVAGANLSLASAITDASGTASFTYSGMKAGNDTVQASYGSVFSSPASAGWIVPAQPVSTTSVYGQFFSSDLSTTEPYPFDTQPTATPLFTQWFPAITFNPPPGAIPGNTSGVDVGTRPFTNVTTDANGNFTGTIVAQGNGYQAGSGSITGFQAVFTGSLVVANGGNSAITVYVDNTFILGIGGGATRVSGSVYNDWTVTPFQQLPIMGSGEGGIGPFPMTVNFPGPGTYPYEVDYVECCWNVGWDTLSLTMMVGAPNADGVAPGITPSSSLTLSPNSVSMPLVAGNQQQTFTVSAVDASGDPVTNATVGLVITGANSSQLSGVTDSTGHATIAYTGASPGTDSVQAITNINGMMAYSNAVSLLWVPLNGLGTASNAPGSTQSITVSYLPTVTLPNQLTLGGNVIDNTFGASVNVNWSLVSGPGIVTFGSPQQPVTTVTFSVAGNYILQLTATDSVSSGSAQVPITVFPIQPVTQGWIGSPADSSAVSGVVPITLAPGVTLASGTLSYSPASDTTQINVLNPNANGSGQIGTFDTTLLRNGSYWVQLDATDINGNTQDNLAFVTVVGDYKPGRVTTTVTDLTVPAPAMPIKIGRTYDSLNKDRVGDFGYGWSLTTRVDLEVGPRGDVTFTLGGRRRTFYFTPKYLIPPVFAVVPLFVAEYTGEPGLPGTLTGSGSGCQASDFFDLLVPYGSSYACGYGGNLYSPPGYVYTDPAGTQYTMGADGTLQSILDLNGNGLTITASGITSTTGLNVPFVRDSQGRITQISYQVTDASGNTHSINYAYQYDANGNLATITFPGIATPGNCQYDSTHLYKGGTDPRGNPLPAMTYDADNRLQSVTDALGNTVSYAYDLTTNTTTTTYPPDASGNVGTATQVYDNYGMLLTSTDPLGNTTTNVYDVNHNLTSTTDPLGHTTSYTYDANGNQTSKTYPRTATSVNTTSSTVYNQYSEVLGTKDELGNVTALGYDANFLPSSIIDNLNGTPVVRASFSFNSNGTLQAGAIGYDITVS
ncbi:MAG: Ig-like domain-containing protein, partial [Bryobacteraceae bacterium]